MTAQQIVANGKLRTEFSSVADALRFIYRCDRPADWARVLGNNGKIWVLAASYAQILIAAGYEYAGR
ncbi:hypothetical protein FAES_2262 [Fibrella aestuarina BUZ 2]|uniref:Uncharacterized protein n=1 Tax=Fibrella aestuarina BUZ 2 TaxID=1166018 RepID=I0K818_9BACT|nr:hypothetical protein [Fibrella aestuarina]CCH00271.1 hypothetical protein FAES_2262 [Fibrella aestuarina BUZ 2]